jgi:hypothetical protein
MTAAFQAMQQTTRCLTDAADEGTPMRRFTALFCAQNALLGKL